MALIPSLSYTFSMLWNLNKALFTVNEIVITTFIAFFIWSQNSDLRLILIFSLAFFASVPIGSLLAGLIIGNISSKMSVILANIFQIVQLMLVVWLSKNLQLADILIIGAVGGLAEGLRNTSIMTIDVDKRVGNNIRYFSEDTFFSSIAKLIVPLTAGYIVTRLSSGYIALFYANIFVAILSITLTTFSKIPHLPSKYELKAIFTIPGTNPDKPALVKGTLLEGLTESISITILPIILLSFVGTVFNWSILNTALLLLMVLMSFIFKELLSSIGSKVAYNLTALFFAAASIFLVAQYNFIVIAVFLIAKSLMDLVKSVSYDSSVQEIIEEDRVQYKLHPEYQFLTDTFTSIGRILPIILLLLLNVQPDNSLVMRFLFLWIGIMPLITISVLGKTAIFTQEKEEEIKSIRNDDIPTLSGNPAGS